MEWIYKIRENPDIDSRLTLLVSGNDEMCSIFLLFLLSFVTTLLDSQHCILEAKARPWICWLHWQHKHQYQYNSNRTIISAKQYISRPENTSIQL